jgi:hypothetical protein
MPLRFVHAGDFHLSMTWPKRVIAVDVQTSLGCPYVVLDESGERVLRTVVNHHKEAEPSCVSVGIAAP